MKWLVKNGAFFSAFVYKQAVATAASCLIPLCSGVNFGISAVMLPQLRVDKSIQYHSDHESWIASVSILSVIIGSLVSGQILDSCGRKAAHIILGVPLIIGWIIIACANSTSIIIAGRFIAGLSSGANKVVTMIYISEITEPRIRTIALIIPSLAMQIGVMFSHIVGHYMYWKTSSMLCIFCAIFPLVAFLFLKESPLWLIARGRTDEGVENFRWFRGTSDASEAELKTVLERQSVKPKISAKETFNTIFTRAFMKPMLILMIVVLNLQLSGVNALNFYSLDIVQEVFKGNADPFIIMIVIDCIRFIVTISICVFGKLISRKISLLVSIFGTSVSVFGLVACFLTHYDGVWVSIMCLLLYVSFASAIVTTSWTFVPELLPNSARGFGSGFNSAVSFLLLFVMVKTTPDILKSYGVAAMYASYGISAFVCGVILCFALPDTSGKTLQSIEDGYNAKKVEESTV